MVERAESKPAEKVVAGPVPTVVVFEITTVFTDEVESVLELVVGFNGETRLSKKFPVVPAEGVSLSVPVIPPKTFEDEDEEDSEEVSVGLKLVIVELT